jgi:serine/threonine protein kinase
VFCLYELPLFVVVVSSWFLLISILLNCLFYLVKYDIFDWFIKYMLLVKYLDMARQIDKWTYIHKCIASWLIFINELQVGFGKRENFWSWTKIKQKGLSHNIMQHLDVLQNLRHRHMVSVLGHCIITHQDPPQVTSTIFILLEYISNVTLRDQLTGKLFNVIFMQCL